MTLMELSECFKPLIKLHIYLDDKRFYDVIFACNISEHPEIKNSSVYRIVPSGIDVVYVYIKELEVIK